MLPWHLVGCSEGTTADGSFFNLQIRLIPYRQFCSYVVDSDVHHHFYLGGFYGHFGQVVVDMGHANWFDRDRPLAVAAELTVHIGVIVSLALCLDDILAHFANMELIYPYIYACSL